MTCKHCGGAREDCSCDKENAGATPISVANRPGLDALQYRAGTHGAFLETMKARLATMTVSDPGGDMNTVDARPLARLTTRDSSDPAIAMLDAWATVGDVLTFYQERIANEGFLRTATERRSVLELARLVGYTPRPGVAATAYLAFTVDDDRSVTPPKPVTTTIPKGTRAQSIPGPGETPQTFETADEFEARSTWNALRPRLTQPQTAASIKNTEIPDGPRVYLQGTNTNLKVNDPLLIDFGDTKDPVPMRVADIEVDRVANRTKISLRSWAESAAQEVIPKGQTRNEAVQVQQQHIAGMAEIGGGWAEAVVREEPSQKDLLKSLMKPASRPPANEHQMERSIRSLAGSGADFGPRFLAKANALLAENIYRALGKAEIPEEASVKVYALRVTASLFGHNAPQKYDPKSQVYSPWGRKEIVQAEEFDNNGSNSVYLDSSYDRITPDTWVIVDSSAANAADLSPFSVPYTLSPLVALIGTVKAGITRFAYQIAGESTQISLMARDAKPTPWLSVTPPDLEDKNTIKSRTREVVAVNESPDNFQIIRRTIVYAQAEELTLAEEPVVADIGAVVGPKQEDGVVIKLDGLYGELESGRWLIVSGERVIDGINGIAAAELVMLAMIRHTKRRTLPGDKSHTILYLERPLAYTYKRDTVVIYANVVKATQGETRTEILGSGDASQPLQSFQLKQPPLTFVPANVPAGVTSTLEVQINDVTWPERDTLLGCGPRDRAFSTKTGDASETTVVFGNGVEGARLPTGVENVRAVYRSGIGKVGNVRAGQISQLLDRPLSVKEVTNPLHASGGADRETRDQARENAPLAVTALDRLVSVQDYADFTRTFAGIGKAVAARLSDGQRELVHITIAGADDVPIDPSSELHQMLLAALRRYGDPDLPIQVEARERLVLMLSANIQVARDYHWEPVVIEVRQRLLNTFGFARRALGQSIALSEIISVIQNTPGVGYVDVDSFGGIAEIIADRETRRLRTMDDLTTEAKKVLFGEVKAAVVMKTSAAALALLPPSQFLPVSLAGFDPASSGARPGIHPAQLAIFVPALPETLILNQVK